MILMGPVIIAVAELRELANKNLLLNTEVTVMWLSNTYTTLTLTYTGRTFLGGSFKFMGPLHKHSHSPPGQRNFVEAAARN